MLLVLAGYFIFKIKNVGGLHFCLLFLDVHFGIVDNVFVAVNSHFILRLMFDRRRRSEKKI